MDPSLFEQKTTRQTSGLFSEFCQAIWCFKESEVEVDGYSLCRVHAAARVAANQAPRAGVGDGITCETATVQSVLNPAIDRDIRLLEWAKATAAAPDDQTITIPAEFDRDEAMYALELEIMRGMQADAFMAPLIKAGQGRDPIDDPRVTWAIVGCVLAVVAVLLGLCFLLGRVLP